jgi:hypothetical protein
MNNAIIKEFFRFMQALPPSPPPASRSRSFARSLLALFELLKIWPLSTFRTNALSFEPNFP